MKPSVTQVLATWANFNRVHPDVLEAAAERGSEVHAVCAAIAKGLWYEEPREEVAGYVAGFQKWFAWVEKVWLVEEQLTDPILGFTGTPDLVVTIRGDSGAMVLDLKTPRVVIPSWRLQVAAYHHLAEKAGINVCRAGVLRLAPNGVALTEFKTLNQDFAVFLAALTCWRFFYGQW